ncbi:MAG: hypothetical protein HYV77_04125 [Candidatus Wildermuthbacteria bacterium]|nr:hypothetical protein [Candidatus Wildermuthbacteria bacterium]
MSEIDELLKQKAFALNAADKSDIFLSAMTESIHHHYNHCPQYKMLLDGQGFDPFRVFSLADIPFLPVSLFKEVELVTGPREAIKKKALSSATTTGKPSIIFLDQTTINRQQSVLRSLLAEFVGSKRKGLFAFEKKHTSASKTNESSSHASAVAGMLPIAKSLHFLLDESSGLDFPAVERALLDVHKEDDICFFGFTWLIYKMLLDLKQGDTQKYIKLKNILSSLPNKKILLHIGGWKKLKDIQVEKDQFNKEIGEFLGIDDLGAVIDIYGMTEQLGTIYPDCEFRHKHTPIYSEVIIRDIETLAPCPIGVAGFIQLLTPIPSSYPGVSILSDDIGKIMGIDNCPCGRKGTYFVFQKRAEAAEIKGCGDAFEVSSYEPKNNF